VRYLITGGSGFIGSNLVRHLLASDADFRVTNLDALTYAGNPDNLREVEDDARYTFVRGDICDPEVVGEVMADADLVIHLAAESHVDRSIQSGAPFVRTNVLGTQTLLAAALEAGVERFVHVSTDEVYPRFREEDALRPRSPYAASKAAADHLALAWHTTHGLDVVLTRCSNNYGPYQFPEKLIPVVVTHALEDRTIPVYGDGLYVRDWIHVEDHCRGILAAAKRGQAGGIYNFGGDAERTNLRLVHTVLDLLAKPRSLIEHVRDRPGHDRRYAVDWSRAEEELGWRPAVGFEEGLERTVAWYREHRVWWERVRSGDYWRYHEEQYGG
jgi:dTDP-glucose 4,6-dehydratase